MCLLGYYCNYDSHEPQDCPVGHYCDFNSEYPTACPRGTYNPYTNMGQLNDCLPCQAGYTCADEGIGNIRGYQGLYKCPLGHYCERGINIRPQPCIAGSFRDDRVESGDASYTFTGAYSGSGSASASSIKDCQLCPKGYFCPEGTADRYANPCPQGSTCPYGSGEP